MATSNALQKYASVPDDLKRLDQWVCWKYETRGDKKTKVPVQTNGRNASSTDPSTWSSFETCAMSGAGDGIGFVLTPECGLVGIDFDKCLDAFGSPETWVAKTISELDSYTEVSPSGRGVRIFARGSLDPKGPNKCGRVEMYDRARFVTVTGDVDPFLSGQLLIRQIDGQAWQRRLPTLDPKPRGQVASSTVPQRENDPSREDYRIIGQLRRDNPKASAEEIERLFRDQHSEQYCRQNSKHGRRNGESYIRYCIRRQMEQDARTEKRNGTSLWVARGDQLEMQVVEWFWDKKFASKELNVLCGLPDRGKGTLLADLIARVTTGEPLPGETEKRQPSDVLIFSGEESVETTTLPRIVAAGGSRSRLHFVQGVEIRHDASREARSVALDSDSQTIRDYLAEHPDIRLVVLDPVNAYFGGDKNSAHEVRKVYGTLKLIADGANVCFVLVDHFNKNTFQNAIHRIGGSQDAGAAPRSAWVVEKDEENPDTRHLACLKCNIISDEDKTGWEFRIVSQPLTIGGRETSVGRVEWLRVSKKSGEELVSKPIEIDGPQLRAAKAFYEGILEAGQPRLQADLFQELERLGVSERTAKRALRELGISGSSMIQRRSGRWWLVPPKGANKAQDEPQF